LELPSNCDVYHCKFIEMCDHIYVLVLFLKPFVNWEDPSEYVVEHLQMIE